MPENLPDDPELLKQLLAKVQSRVGFLEEENALLRQRLFGRKSEQTADPTTPQLALFNEAESVVEPIDEASEEEVVAPTQPNGAASASRCPLISLASKSSMNCPHTN
ncbi:hypothetical protein J3D60_002222 [Pseudomonas sp. S3E17]|nr:hypothetical protein [Pseudomonas sp. S3E17]